MPERMAHVGGNWNNGGNAGVFYLNGNNVRGNSNSNIGSRPASPSLPYGTPVHAILRDARRAMEGKGG